MEILLVVLISCLAVVISGQYYQPLNANSFELNYNTNQNSYDDTNGQQSASADYVEKKFVNSGQSIVLICDLPNNMPDGKVLFIKYDSKVLSSASGINIRGDSDDERFEIGQQYAWEWSLKINSINEDDSGIYLCKVGNTIIKRFEIVVRVPPRIRDNNGSPLSATSLDLQQTQPHRQIAREGATVEFACFATGTPRPNITWYVIQSGTPQLLAHSGTYLRIENVTRLTPTRYQCRASNGIPPSDTRNLTLSVEFAPEIEIQSRFDSARNIMNLNCTIVANPLTNRNFWRKDGSYLTDPYKYEVENIRINEYTLISKLLIKNYDDQSDPGLYECTAENDLRVSKIVFNLREDSLMSQKPIDLLQIGSSSAGGGEFPNDFAAASINKHKTKKPIQTTAQNRSKSTSQTAHRRNKPIDENSSSSSINNVNYEVKTSSIATARKHQRNHRNNSLKTSTSGQQHQPTTEEIKSYKSPYIILIDEESSSESSSSSDQKTDRNSASDSYLNQAILQNSASTFSTSRFGILFVLFLVCWHFTSPRCLRLLFV